MKKRERKPSALWLKWVCCLMPLVLAATLYFLLPLLPATFTEYVITRGIFRVISLPLNWLVSIFPFSVTEMVVILCIPAILTLLSVFIYRLIRREDRKQIAEKGVRFVCFCLSLAALLYMIMHGANYNRLSVGELMNFNDSEYDAAFLKAVTADLAKKASATRELVAEDEDGYMVLSTTMSEALLHTDNCYDNLREEYPFLFSGTWRVKPVMLSPYWSYTGITGMYCPWLGESNINTDVADSEIPHTAAHEVAHTMGFSREDACNFIAYLGCITSDNPDYVYSGYLSAYIHCSNALYNHNKKAGKAAAALCSDAVKRDLKQRNSYWKGFEGEVMDTSTDFNDTFIKVNGVESGVLNYSEVVSLILRYYDTHSLLG